MPYYLYGWSADENSSYLACLTCWTVEDLNTLSPFFATPKNNNSSNMIPTSSRNTLNKVDVIFQRNVFTSRNSPMEILPSSRRQRSQTDVRYSKSGLKIVICSVHIIYFCKVILHYHSDRKFKYLLHIICVIL